MNLFEAIEKRHSYRGIFLSQPIPREDLRKIVEAGIHAPSAKNEQVVSFVVVDDKETLAEIAKLIPRPYCETAQATIACVVDPRPILGPLSFAAEDCGAAAENMLLAITALGYATVWLDGVLRRDGLAEAIGKLLGVPANLEVAVLLPLGKPVESGSQAAKKPFEERARFNRA